MTTTEKRARAGKRQMPSPAHEHGELREEAKMEITSNAQDLNESDHLSDGFCS